MLSRCGNPNAVNYKWYGEKGIAVAKEWHSFAAFFRSVGLRPTAGHTLDRFPDRNGNYMPGNVRWATWDQQAQNKDSYTGGRPVSACHKRGPKISCRCGRCLTCLQREYQRKRRKGLAAKKVAATAKKKTAKKGKS